MRWNILQTCFSKSWGGLELQALEVSRKLQERGHTVWLACCAGSKLESEGRAADVKVLPLQVTGYLHPTAIWKLSRLIRNQAIDIIHAQHSKDIATIVPAMNLARKRVPLLLSKRVGSYINKKDLLHRYTYSHVDRVLAISKVIQQNVLDTTPMAANKVLVLHDSIDTTLYSLARSERDQVRLEFGLHQDTIVVGFVGRFSPGKGHEDLLEAAKLLRENYKNIHFLIVGEASYGERHYEEHIHGLAHSYGLQDVVTFAGFRRDIPDVMASFDVFVFPSHAEAFGLVLIEAMAMERPVVSTNCDGVVDIVVDGETGLSVPPRSPAQLAEKIGRLISDSAMRERMGKAGRKQVEALFDQKKMMDRIEEIYTELMSERRQ